MIENITTHYMACLGVYRAIYILNWFYRYETEGFYCWTQILAGLLQTGLYMDFLYNYFKALKSGKGREDLPF